MDTYLECATSCLLMLVDSWMVLRAYPEKGRSIGQGNTELSWVDKGVPRDGVIGCWGCWQYRLSFVISIIVSLLQMPPLCAQGRGDVVVMRRWLSSWWGAWPLSLPLVHFSCATMRRAVPPHHTTYPWGVNFNGSARGKQQIITCMLNIILAAEKSVLYTKSMHPHLTFLFCTYFHAVIDCLLTPFDTQAAVSLLLLPCVSPVATASPATRWWPIIHKGLVSRWCMLESIVEMKWGPITHSNGKKV